jgi:dihydroorotate dehydrogenase electron transfer subunit
MLYKLFQICVKHDIEFFASLERIMRCGCGLCGLCALDPLGLLVCKDGPIFSSIQLVKIEDFGKYTRDFTGKKINI